MKRFAIINPTAGSGKTGRSLSVILDGLKGAMDGHMVTGHPGHCREAARAAAGYDCLIAVGGDGTVCEVVNGMDLARQSLAIVPTGTGNSLARDSGFKELDVAFQRVRGSNPVAVDLIRFEFRDADGTMDSWFCTGTASIGYAARVTGLANARLKKLGPLCYPVSSLVCALVPQRMHYRVSYDNGQPVRKKLTGIMVQNCRHAANFELFPHASVFDGFFDILETDAGFIGQTLHNISVLSRTHFFKPAGTARAKTLHFAAERPQTLMIDGEILSGITDVRMTIAPGRLKCFL